MRQSVLILPVILYFIKVCVARIFLGEFHLGYVLELLSGVGSKKKFTKFVDTFIEVLARKKCHKRQNTRKGRKSTFLRKKIPPFQK